MLQKLKDFAVKTAPGRWIQDRRWLADLERYRSRLPRHEARRYQTYFEECQRVSAVSAGADSEFAAVARSWREDGYAVLHAESMRAIATEIDADLMARDAAGEIWDEEGGYTGDVFLDFPAIGALFRPQAPLARAIRSAFGSEFKIFYCKLYRSRRIADAPSGSQLWHADGGPGTCMNLMFALTPLTAANGAMELLAWRDSLGVFAGERARMRNSTAKGMAHRDLVCAYYTDRISALDPAKIRQPAGPPGTALMFMNNLVHKGGFPPDSHAERRVLVLHVYPSDEPAPIDGYLRNGLKKTASYPKNPDF